jgi:SAM-dependent methyltransferase
MLKKYAIKIFNSWTDENIKSVLNNIEPNKNASLVDLGCGDGVLTARFSKRLGSKKIFAVDGLKTNIKGVKTIKSNLNKRLPFQNNLFDVAVSHYSIEHLYNTGEFIYEMHRILKKGGYGVIATDNLAAWPNVLSLIFGYQPFSMTMGVGKNALGNPFAVRMNMKEIGDSSFNLNWRKSGEFSHNKVLSYKMLIDAFKEYGFEIERIDGIGYFPFYGRISKIFCKIDKRHSHLLVLKVRKI